MASTWTKDIGIDPGTMYAGPKVKRIPADPTKDPAVVEAVLRWADALYKRDAAESLGTMLVPCSELADAVRDGKIKP